MRIIRVWNENHSGKISRKTIKKDRQWVSLGATFERLWAILTHFGGVGCYAFDSKMDGDVYGL